MATLGHWVNLEPCRKLGAAARGGRLWDIAIPFESETQVAHQPKELVLRKSRENARFNGGGTVRLWVAPFARLWVAPFAPPVFTSPLPTRRVSEDVLHGDQNGFYRPLDSRCAGEATRKAGIGSRTRREQRGGPRQLEGPPWPGSLRITYRAVVIDENLARHAST